MVSIIILSYNTKDLLKNCLSSVEKVVPSGTYEVIVVDNLSVDDSVEMVKKEFKDVTVIQNTENAGFAKGCNLGASHAKGELLLFLNSDAVMKENPLPKMVSLFESEEKVAVVGGSLKNFDGSDQRSFGQFYNLPQVAVMLFGGEKTELKVHQSNAARDVEWVSGGFMMVKKGIFDTVRGFDGHFFMYIEDMELCYRIRKRGYRIMHQPQAVVSHVGQGSSNKSFAIIHIYKGLRYFYKKHKNAVSYATLLFLLRSKAYIAIMVGRVTHDMRTIDTYQKALSQ